MLKEMTVYGRLVVGEDTYILLRPVRFEPEHYELGINEVAYFVAYIEEEKTKPFSPHILVISGENYHIDKYPVPRTWMIRVDEETEEPIDFKPIDKITEPE